MKRALVLLLALTFVPMVGCGPKQKKKKKDIRAEKGIAKLEEIMAGRRKRLLSNLPKSDKPEGDSGHPYLEWMGKVAGTVSRTEFKKVGVIARGTKVAGVADTLATWMGAQKKFYFNEKMSPKDYWRDAKLAFRASKGTKWEEDLAFELIFFHVGASARWHDLFAEGRGPRDDRVTYFSMYRNLVFDFKPKTSLFQEETNVLCNTKLGDYCKEIPMELRPFQVMKPYYEKIIGQLEAFKKTYPQSGYNTFVDRLIPWYQARIKAVPKWEEFPKLPGIRSTVAAPVSGNAALFVTSRGIGLMGIALRKPGQGEPPWKADWTKPDTDLQTRVSQLMDDTRKSTVSNYNQSNMLLVPDPDVALTFIEPLLKSSIIGEHAKEWPTVLLVGRRRSDGSNQRAAFTITLLAADKTIPFKLKAPGAKGKAKSCAAWAVVGRDKLEAKGFTPAIYHDGKQVHAGKLGADGTLRSPQSAAPHGEGDRLEKWADSQQTSIVVAVDSDAPYKRLLEALNGVALRCADKECKTSRTQPVFVATCK
ncbi:MAG: hypothetical protein KC502_07910 [Myxococcales bacterium]|nr:hypothetical protein [Myxococcales bacterium]